MRRFSYCMAALIVAGLWALASPSTAMAQKGGHSHSGSGHSGSGHGGSGFGGFGGMGGSGHSGFGGFGGSNYGGSGRNYGGYSTPQGNYYTPSQPQYSQPVTPLKNTVVVAPTKPNPNTSVHDLALDGLAQAGSAETDAQQALIADQLGGKLDEEITKLISDHDAATKDAWVDVLVGRTLPQEFKAKFGSKFKDPYINTMLDTRGKITDYINNLEKGTLTGAGKDAAINGLRDALTKLKPGTIAPPTDANIAKAGKTPIDPKVAQAGPNAGAKTPVGPDGTDPAKEGNGKGRVMSNVTGGGARPAAANLGQGGQQGINQMQRLNILGQLADLAGGVANALDILLAGAGNGGFPPIIIGDVTLLPIMEGPYADTKSARPDTVFLWNPLENKQSVNYTLNDQYPYTMQPSSDQSLDDSYTIAFDSGGSGGTKRYGLSSGSYRWVKGADGWDLNKSKFSVTIDNTAYPADFNYVLNNEHKSVKAGQKETWTHDFPMEVTFDRGDGKESARKLLKGGKYVVGVDTKQQRLDLFPVSDETQLPVRRTGLARSQRVQDALKNSSRQTEIVRLIAQLKPNASRETLAAVSSRVQDAVKNTGTEEPARSQSASNAAASKPEIDRLLRELKSGAPASP